MDLDLLGSSGFLSLGDRCGEKLGLDPWRYLGGSSIGHLLLLLDWLSRLNCHLLGANLREMVQSIQQDSSSSYKY